MDVFVKVKVSNFYQLTYCVVSLTLSHTQKKKHFLDKSNGFLQIRILVMRKLEASEKVMPRSCQVIDRTTSSSNTALIVLPPIKRTK